MSFHAAGAGAQFDVLNIVLKQIFQLPDCVGGQTWGCVSGAVAQDIIFALFLPHVVLLFYLFLMTSTIPPFQKHKGMASLFGIGIYVFLVFQGWYAVLAQWFVGWLAVTIAFSLFYFFFVKIVHPGETGARFRLGKELGKKFKNEQERQKALRKFRDEEQRVEDRIEDLRSQGAPAEEIQQWTEYLQQIKNKIREMED